MQPLKRGEEFFRLRHVEPGTVVPDVEDGFLFLDGTPKCYAGCRPLRVVLPRVAEHVHEENWYERGVPECAKSVSDVDRNLPSRISILEISDHAVRQFCQIDHFLPEWSA